MKVVGYVRVSSESQIENTSIVEQEERIQAYCKARGWELIKIFRDEGLSGKQTE
ncbi:TPA: recombinase family protein, partial [Streptococcus agalactiae]